MTDTIEHYHEDGSRTRVRLLRHQRAAHIGGDLYVIRKSSLEHLARYTDNLASELLHTVDDADEKGEAA